MYDVELYSKVSHVKDQSLTGFIVELDSDYDLGGVTTCRVAWGASSLEDAKYFNREDTDIQFTNKLVKVD